MPTCKFDELGTALRKTGFDMSKKKKGEAWSGISPFDGEPVQIVIHGKSKDNGKDIPTGTFHQYVSRMGAGSNSEFVEWVKKNC